MFRTLTIVACALCSPILGHTQASVNADKFAYLDAYQSAIEAFRNGDHATLVQNARTVLTHLPDQSTALYLLAVGRARQGWVGDAASTLKTIADQGLSTQLSAVPAFAPMLEGEEYAALRQQFINNREFSGERSLVVETSLDSFVPEGLLALSRQTYLLGSIHQSRIVQIEMSADEDPVIRDWVSAGQDGLCSVLSLKASDDNQLIFASTACMQQTDGVDADRLGRSGIFVYKPNGQLVASHWLPQDDDQHVLGDLLVWDTNSIIASDSLSGAILRLDLESSQYQEITRHKRFPNPQGLAKATQTDEIYVADYLAGVYRLNITTGAIIRLENPELAAIHGIDGLVRCQQTLIGIQNGVKPQRIIALELDAQGHSIVNSHTLAKGLPEWDEPTQAIQHGNSVVYVANSHWPQFTASGELPDGLDGPRLMSLKVDACGTL